MSEVLEKNSKVSLTVTDFSENGEGIGRASGIPVFVQGAVIGDTVKAHLTKVKKNLAYARIEEIVTPSADRVEAPCAHADKCGGCQLQAYDYQASLSYKKKKVQDALVRIGHFDAEDIAELTADTAGMEDPLRYRNKAQYPTGYDENGQIVFGFYAPHSHRIIPVDDCVVCAKDHKKILAAVRESMQVAGVEPYREEDGTGYVRHVLIRRTKDSAKYLVCLIVNATEALSRFRDVLILQLTQFQSVVSIAFNYNPHRTNVILGDNTENIYGKDYLEDHLCGLTFRVGADVFYQVNPQITERLYRAVVKEAHLTGKETVWDLFCGIGTIALTLAGHGAKEVYGVEVSAEAIRFAKDNTKQNGQERAHFFAADAAAVKAAETKDPCEETTADGVTLLTLPKPDLIVVDPPRKGCEGRLLQTILDAAPKRILYVSCDAATLARDLRLLADGGYDIKAVLPHDMFPFSVHVETLVTLERNEDS